MHATGDRDTSDNAPQLAAVETRFVAFLSYSHADRAAAARLHSFLENYRVPKDLIGRTTRAGVIPARLRPIFRDREDLTAAADLSAEIEAALAASGALIVLCSPAAAASRWVDQEVGRFKARRGEARVFAAVLDGVPFASDDPIHAARECFPPALRRRSDGGPAEPLAADLQRSGDGIQAGRLKIVAGLIGVPLDELVHRDARRRHRRTLAVIAALLIGMTLTTALAVIALRARNEAVRQRAEAEGLIEFMVGDLRKKLEPIGRLSVLDAVGARALQFYKRQDASTLDPDSLGRRARVVQLIGQIDDQRGDLAAAQSNFETAAASTAELLARDPDNPLRIFDHSQSVYWVGYLAYRRGDFARAEPAFESYRALTQQLTRIDPANIDWLAELGYAYSNLATLQFSQGENAAAEDNFMRALDISQRVAAAHDGDVQAQLDLAQAHAWLADTRERRGNLAGATRERLVEASVIDKVLTTDAQSGPARQEAVTIQRALSRLSLQRGDTAAARRHADNAAARGSALVDFDPTNTEWKTSAANAQLQLGDVALATGDRATAEAALPTATRLISALNQQDRSVYKWKLLSVRARLQRAELAAARGDWMAALGTARATQAAIGALPSAGRDDSEARWLLNRARWQTALALEATGDRAGARTEFVTITQDVPAGRDEEPRMMALRAQAFSRLGDHAAAARLTGALAALHWPVQPGQAQKSGAKVASLQ